MRAPVSTIATALRRARRGLKSFCYSGPARGRWQQPGRVFDALPLGQGERAADIGAGGGYFTFRLARAVGAQGRVYAVDTDADMVARIAEAAARDGWGNVVALHAHEDRPALPETVDLVLIVNTFHHLRDPAGYLAALAEQVRVGSRVAVIEPRPRWFLFGHATEPATIRATMDEAGYAFAEEHALPRQSFQVFRRRAA